MPITIYNTLSGKKETFKPLSAGKLKMYQCGPTVYDSAHIGNFRTYVMNDIIRRVFEYNDYAVTQVMNVTDIDDKTLRRSQAEKTTLAELTRRYEALFLADIQSMRILTPHHVLRATDHIEEMIEMISILIEKMYAYPSKDGIYFSIGKFAEYGKLAKLKLDPASSAMLQERIKNDEYEKENPRDFALWKFHTPEDGDVSWEAPFGNGRPGWHIECSAMATKALGETIDIHTGGSDLIFPHHTNEIAQSEATTDKPFVRYWIHGGFMNVDDVKMAKSKGNFIKLADFEAETISPLGFRYWLLTSHYRTQVNFSFDAVRAAQSAFIRLAEAFIGWDGGGSVDSKYAKRFKDIVSDDFDMPKAVALVWELVKDAKITGADKRATLIDFDRVLGLGFEEMIPMSDMAKARTAIMMENIPPEVIVLAEAREEARLAKEWDKADALRAEIEERGYTVKDLKQAGKDGKKFELLEL